MEEQATFLWDVHDATKNFPCLWKENLNNDGRQFHQYQQNEQSPLILTELGPGWLNELGNWIT
jgi:hypothetical protein